MAEKKVTETNNKEKNYTVIADELYVRDMNGKVLRTIKKGAKFIGIVQEDKIINKNNETVVSKFVE